MLHEFIAAHSQEIVLRARARVRAPAWPPASSGDTEQAMQLFLTQLSERLRAEAIAVSLSSDAMGAAAARHGAELLAAGIGVSQVVHDYADLCQVITEIAVETHEPISVEEFHTLNRCLDIAIAEAVTEHTRLQTENQFADEVGRLGRTAHELRDLLNNAQLAFQALRRGVVPISGNTGGILERSLAGLRDLVDRTLAEVRLAAGKQRRERLSVATFIEQIASASALHSESRGVGFVVAPVDPSLAVDGDPLLLSSAVMNLVHNGFKNTPTGGAIMLRAFAHQQRLLVEIEDECGGIPEAKRDLFRPYGQRVGKDRAGLGLGLAIAQEAVQAHDGEIRVRNLPGKGCVFTIEVPLAAGTSRVASA